MGANKHHYLVCLHTPRCPPINAHPHNLPTKLPPTKDITHNHPLRCCHPMLPNAHSPSYLQHPLQPSTHYSTSPPLQGHLQDRKILHTHPWSHAHAGGCRTVPAGVDELRRSAGGTCLRSVEHRPARLRSAQLRPRRFTRKTVVNYYMNKNFMDLFSRF